MCSAQRHARRQTIVFAVSSFRPGRVSNGSRGFAETMRYSSTCYRHSYHKPLVLTEAGSEHGRRASQPSFALQFVWQPSYATMGLNCKPVYMHFVPATLARFRHQSSGEEKGVYASSGWHDVYCTTTYLVSSVALPATIS